MNRVDFLLNLAGLLLWLGWRAVRFRGAVAAPTAISRVLKQAEPARAGRWVFLASLAALLVVRAILYWRVGSALNWVPVLDVGAINLPFNSVSPWRMLLYSGLSFLAVWVVFHLWLLLLSIVNRGVPDSEPWQRMVREHLGWMEAWPWVVKVATPVFLVAGAWWLALPALAEMGMTLTPVSVAHLAQQSGLVGLGALLAWKYLIASVLFLAVLNAYLYLGSWSLWTFVQTTSRNLLRPLDALPLRLGRIDFAPILGLALTWLAFTYAEKGLNLWFGRLPL